MKQWAIPTTMRHVGIFELNFFSMPKPRIVGTAADITPDWMNRTLAAGGAEYPTVTRVVAEPAGADRGLVDEILRCRLAYASEDPEAPASVILKLSGRSQGSRTMSRRFGLHAREYAFYTRLGDHVPVRTPRLYYIDFDPETDDLILVQEDLGGMQQVDQVAGATPDQARTALRGLAALHARFLGRTRDERLAADVWTRMTRWEQMLLQGLYLWLLPSVLRQFGDCFTPRLRRLALDLGCSLTAFRKRTESLAPLTLTHGDFRLDNMFFDPRDPAAMTLIDWQVCAIAPGMRDVAYFLATNVKPEVRRSLERDAVAEYGEAMARAGTVLDPDVWWLAYRMSILGGLRTSVMICGSLDAGTGRTLELVRTGLRRSLTAIEDLDAGELLPKFRGGLPSRLLWRGFGGAARVFAAMRRDG